MRILNPTFNWQAQNLPDGLSIHNGIISGTPTTLGTFSVPVTVSNSLGNSTKNISIIVRNRPGAQKFSILQNGVEIEKVSIPELQTMVQNGSAQEKYNCNNTQIVLPISLPVITRGYFDPSDGGLNAHPFTTEPTIVDVPVNFCDFRNITLQDGTIKQGLILQFDIPLWPNSTIFDAFYDANVLSDYDVKGLNRWKFSMLRNWLNSSGKNWFARSYPSQASPDYLISFNSYVLHYIANSDAVGFLFFLPDDLVDILQPVKVQTQAYFDENNSFGTDVPDYIDGEDVDVTYDKVFIPSFEEMNINMGFDSYPVVGIEGNAWQYYKNLFNSQSAFNIHGIYPGKGSILDNKLHNYVGEDVDVYASSVNGIITRSAERNSATNFLGVGFDSYYSTQVVVYHMQTLDDYALSYIFSPVPAFVIC